MALPKQVQDQADALEAYEKAVAEAKATEPNQEVTQEAEPAKEPVQQSPEPVSAEPVKSVEDDPNSLTWRQRYQSLQGQFNSQVPALQQQVRQMTDSVEQLTARLEAAEAAKAAPRELEASELVTKTDVDAFGEDLVDLARRIAKEEFGRRESTYVKQIEALESKLTEAKGTVGEVVQSQAASAQERFFDNLTAALPTWEAIQATDQCQTWLSSRIPGSTATWNDALVGAAGRRDVSAVVEVFDAFFERNPALNPKAKQQEADTARQELNRQVAPGKSSASTSTPTSRRTYTGAEFQSESMRLMRLQQKGSNDDAARLDAELNAALAEGRVKP